MKTKICKIIYTYEDLQSCILLEKTVSFVTIRIDHLREYSNDEILQFLPSFCKSIYSLGNADHSGSCDEAKVLLSEQLNNAIKYYDYIELEHNADEKLINNIPSDQRIISWHGQYQSKKHLKDLIDNILQTEAAYYKISPVISKAEQGISLLEILKETQNNKLILYGQGPAGLWTQVYAVHVGSPIIYCQQKAYNQDHFTYEQLVKDYNFPEYRKVTRLFGIVGNPVYNSLSPRIHNSCYHYYGMDNLYLPFHINSFEEFEYLIKQGKRFRDLGVELCGFTMVSPYKEDTYNFSKHALNKYSISSRAANILALKDGVWVTDSSDGYAVFNILKSENQHFPDINVAIFGCGGAGRTIAAMLQEKGAKVHLFNRSAERGEFAKRILSIRYDAIDQFEINGFDVIINATPLGKNGEEPCFDPSELNKETIIIDMTYSKDETPLVRKSRILGMRTYEGKDILLFQVSKQFKSLTNIIMPTNMIREMIYGEKKLMER